MRVEVRDGDSLPAWLTTNHAASSYGFPVLVVGGRALGAADVPAFGKLIAETEQERAELEAAGYVCAVEVKP